MADITSEYVSRGYSEPTCFSSPQEILMYKKEWIPKGPVRASVLFLHGIGEYCDRYQDVFTAFAKEGIRVLSFDQRGFGKTLQKYGSIGSSEGMATVVKDVLYFADLARIKGLPLFGMGQSYGGGMVLRMGILHPDLFDGIIATSPLVDLAEATQPNFLLRLALNTIPFVWPTFPLPTNLNRNYLSQDPETVAKATEDKLMHGYVSGQLAYDLMGIRDFLVPNAARFKLPLLITHGTGDLITSADATAQFFQKVNSVDKEFKEYQGLYHELHFEIPKERKLVIKKYIDWIQARW